jgi:hypothetical protein
MECDFSIFGDECNRKLILEANEGVLLLALVGTSYGTSKEVIAN